MMAAAQMAAAEEPYHWDVPSVKSQFAKSYAKSQTAAALLQRCPPPPPCRGAAAAAAALPPPLPRCRLPTQEPTNLPIT
jgi:hypothetical protein